VDRHAFPFDGNLDAGDKAHAGFLGRRPGDSEAAQIVVIGQRPEIDAIGCGPPRNLLRRQQAVRNG